MKKTFGRLAVLAVLAVLVLSLQGAQAAAPSGTATASSTLVRLVAGDRTVALGTDVAESTRGKTTNALARLVAGRANDVSIGAGERTAQTRSESGRTEIAKSEPQTVDGLLTLDGVQGAVEAKVTSVNVRSLVSVDLGDSSILGKLAVIGGGASVSNTLVNDEEASSTRRISIDSISVLALGDFLAALGVNPFALACDAVESVGGIVGVDTAQACETLSTAQDLVGQVASTLQGAQGQLESTRAQLQATIDGAQAQLTTLQGQKSTLESQKASLESQIAGLGCSLPLPPLACSTLQSDLTNVNSQIASVNSQIDATQAQIDSATAQLQGILASVDLVNDPVGSTCGAATDAAGAVADAVGGSLAGTLDSIATQLDAACETLKGLLDGLLSAPLLEVGGVDLSIKTVAREGQPVAAVTGKVGTLKIGVLDPVAVNLSVVSDKVAEIQGMIGDTLGEIAKAVGLSLPIPTFDLLAKETDKGKRSDGTWFAEGSVTALRVHLPAAELTVPATLPLGVLGDSPISIAAVQVSPALTLDLGVFRAASEFKPAAAASAPSDDPSGAPASGGTLPRTGVGGGPLFWTAGILSLCAAALVRRFLTQS